MTAEVITLHAETTLDIPSDRVLNAAIGKLSTVLVLGYDQETGEPYFAGSSSDIGAMFLLIERFKVSILQT